MTPSHEQWASQARYDLETARAMMVSGRYLYVLFCCQQAVEKMIKAIIAKKTGEMPRRIHNLIRLAELAEIAPPSDLLKFFGVLSSYYVQSRYPEEIAELANSASGDMAQEALNQTEESVKWLSSIL